MNVQRTDRRTVIVLGAGGPAGYNVAEAATAAGYRVIGVDSNADHLPWAWKVCDEIVCHPGIPSIAVDRGILVLPQPDALVLECASRDDVLTHLPPPGAIRVAQDKGAALAMYGVPVVPIDADALPDHLALARDALGLPFWLRARRGAGARGALRVDDLRAAYHWVRLHAVLGRDVDWIASPYLPGRDYCWTGLYHDGDLVASFARERLAWLYPHLTLSGRTGTPTIAQTVHRRDVNDAAGLAVRATTSLPHGVFCVDLVEDADGVPVVTEVNAGRWATSSPVYRKFGPNLVDDQIRLAYGMPVSRLGQDVYPPGTSTWASPQ
jgi:biotin carboxylase